MYTIELTLKSTPAMLSVQKNEEEEANKVYQAAVDALKKAEPGFLELTCDRTERRITVRTEELSAVQVTPKGSSVSPSGNRPGFFAQLDATN